MLPALRTPLTVELWQPEPRTGRVDILLKVATQISDLNRGDAAQLPLTILNEDSPALHWLFRYWQVQDVSASGSGCHSCVDYYPVRKFESFGEISRGTAGAAGNGRLG